jgi:two-component system nitrate/nitrite response regulator NarL
VVRDAGNATETAEATPTVLIVEDRRLLADSLAVALAASDFGVEVVAEPSLDRIRDVVARIRPTVAVVAMGIGEGSLTEQAIATLCEEGIPTIVMTGGEDRLRLARCVAEGAVGIIDKSMDVETLSHMVRHAGGADSFLSQRQRYQLEDELRRHRAAVRERLRPLEALSEREREVLMELTRGHRAKDIAERSFVSISTVRSQIKSILAKLGVSSQVQAIAVAVESRWFSSPDPETVAS